jgi:putative ABC transport system permease protein
VILRPLPFGDSNRIVAVAESNARRGWDRAPVSYLTFMDWLRQDHTLDALAAYQNNSVTLSGDGPAEVLQGTIAHSNLFSVLGVTPLAGRLLTAQDDAAGAGCTALLSRGIWSERFGAREDLSGLRLRLDGDGCDVVGVVADLDVPGIGKPALWLSWSTGIQRWKAAVTLENRGQRFLGVLGKLKPAITLDRANADLSDISAQIAAGSPKTNRDWTARAMLLQEQVVGGIRRPLQFLFLAVGLVLFIACANVANLQLARSTARLREMAIRMALGCGSKGLIRQVLIENLVLATCAAAVGCVFAAWLIATTVRLGQRLIPRAQEIHLNVPVLGFSIALALLSALFVGLGPALLASRSDPWTNLRESPRGTTAGGRFQRSVRHALMGLQIAISVALLITTGLAIRSFWAFSSVKWGFQPDHVLAARITPPPSMDGARRTSLYEDILRRVSALPGVQTAGAAQVLPLRNSEWSTSFRIAGRPVTSDRTEVSYNRVAGDYFEAMRIPLRRGRYLGQSDRAGSPPVAVVNEAFVRAFLPGESAIGSRLHIWDPDPPFEIVGVVANTSQRTLDAVGGAMIYIPYAQRPRSSLTLVLRSRGEPFSLAPAVRREVSAASPNQAVSEFTAMEDLVAKSVAPWRYSAMLLSLFSILALVIASAGVYSIVSYIVVQRTTEVGVRIALGATPRSVLAMILRQSMAVGIAGIAVGSVSALFLTRVMSGLIYGISAMDPVTFIVVPLLFFAVVVVAAWMPAARATEVDPMVALRAE